MSDAIQEAVIGQTQENNRPNDQDNKSKSQEIKSSPEIAFGERRPRIGRWTPRRWEEWYNQVVILSTLGLKSNSELSDIYKCTTQHISNILNTPQAAALRKQIHEFVLKNTGESVTIDKMAQKALERVHAVLHNDALFEGKTEFVTSVAMRVLASKLEKKAEAGINVAGNAIIFSATDGDAMRAAIRKSEEADRINRDIPVEPPLRLLKSG